MKRMCANVMCNDVSVCKILVALEKMLFRVKVMATAKTCNEVSDNENEWVAVENKKRRDKR
jgi:hypothetical protein